MTSSGWLVPSRYCLRKELKQYESKPTISFARTGTSKVLSPVLFLGHEIRLGTSRPCESCPSVALNPRCQSSRCHYAGSFGVFSTPPSFGISSELLDRPTKSSGRRSWSTPAVALWQRSGSSIVCSDLLLKFINIHFLFIFFLEGILAVSAVLGFSHLRGAERAPVFAAMFQPVECLLSAGGRQTLDMIRNWCCWGLSELFNR